MRPGIVISGVLFASTLFCLIAAEPAKSRDPAANVILQQVTQREKEMKRVTDKPYSMDIRIATLCRGPDPDELPAENPHRGHSVHVYVSPTGEEILKSGKGTYPVGTLIVKEKFPSPLEHPRLQREDSATTKAEPKLQTELFTAMLKRDPGYDPERGDWEYLVISGNAQQVLARGKLDSCIQCHVEYKATDYVTRAYMKKGL
jgi:hypothetical protein